MALPIAAALTVTTGTFTNGLKVAGSALRVFTTLAVAASAAVAALGAALVVVGKNQLQFIDRLGKVSDVIGLSTELIQKFGYAAEIAGVSFDQSSVALRRFSRRLGEAKKGVGELRPALLEIGLTDTEIRAMSAEEALFALADGIAKTSDQSKRLALAFKAFDSEGAELVAVLAKGSAEMRKLFNEFEDLNVLLDRQSIKKVEELNDSFTSLRAIMLGAANAVLVSLAPALNTAVQDFIELIKNEAKARGGFKEFGQYLKEQLVTVVAKLVRTFVALYNIMVKIGRIIVDLAKQFGLFKTEADDIKTAIGILEDLDVGPIMNFGPLVLDLLKFKTVGEDVRKILEDVLGPAGIIVDDSERLAAIDRLKARLEALGDEGFLTFKEIDDETLNNLLNGIMKLAEPSKEAAKALEEVIVTAPAKLGLLTQSMQLLFGEQRTTEFWLNWMDEGEDAMKKMQAVAQLVLGEELFENLKKGIEAAGIGDFMKTLSEGLTSAVGKFEDALADAVLTGKADFDDLANHLKQVLAKALIQKFITGPILGLFGLGPMAGRAKGGPVSAGTPYIVGEEGPELFVPNASGTIIPNGKGNQMGQMGQATQVIYNINAIDSASFEARLAQNPEYLYNLTQVGARRQPA